MVEPRQVCWVVAKHVLYYLMGTTQFGLRYFGDGELMLHGPIYVDWEGSATEERRNLGCFLSLGSSMVYVEVEYMAAPSSNCETIWLHKLLAELTD